MTLFETIRFLVSGELPPEIFTEKTAAQYEKLPETENKALIQMKKHFSGIIQQTIPEYKCFRLKGKVISGERKIPYDFIIPFEKCGKSREKMINYCVSCAIRAYHSGYKEQRKCS